MRAGVSTMNSNETSVKPAGHDITFLAGARRAYMDDIAGLRIGGRFLMGVVNPDLHLMKRMDGAKVHVDSG